MSGGVRLPLYGRALARRAARYSELSANVKRGNSLFEELGAAALKAATLVFVCVFGPSLAGLVAERNRFAVPSRQGSRFARRFIEVYGKGGSEGKPTRPYQCSPLDAFDGWLF